MTFVSKSNTMRIFTGIQPTDNLHIGNLFGALIPFSTMDSKDKILFVADLHSITKSTTINMKHIMNILRLAMALNDTKCKYFIQSKFSYVTDFMWYFACKTSMATLTTMNQYETYSTTYNNAGLLMYPLLMAADIISIGATHVPIGSDQKQHLELTRNIIQVLNRGRSKKFPMVEPIILPARKIYNIKDSSIKMSKSYGPPMGVIFIDDNSELLKKKVMGAQTDSLSMPVDMISLNSRSPILNLYNIYALVTNLSLESIVGKFINTNFFTFKTDLYIKLSDYLMKIQIKTNKITDTEILTKLDTDSVYIGNIMCQLKEQLYSTITE